MYNHQKACISELSAYFRPFKRLPADSAGNGQILNCSCHTACPLFFLNFIFRFTSIHFIIDTSKYPHDSNTRHERSQPRIQLDFQMSTRNSKKIKIMENLRVASSYVTQLPQKIINLRCGSFRGKVFSETCYHERTFITFKTKEQCFGHFHDIVCPNVPQFGTCVHYGMANNVAE